MACNQVFLQYQENNDIIRMKKNEYCLTRIILSEFINNNVTNIPIQHETDTLLISPLDPHQAQSQVL